MCLDERQREDASDALVLFVLKATKKLVSVSLCPGAGKGCRERQKIGNECPFERETGMKIVLGKEREGCRLEKFAFSLISTHSEKET